jgi:hypothetical protein
LNHCVFIRVLTNDDGAYFVLQSKFCQVTFFLLPFGVGLSICRREAGGGIREGVRIQSLRFSIIATGLRCSRSAA